MAIVVAFLAGILFIHVVGSYVPIKGLLVLGLMTGGCVIAGISLFDDVCRLSVRTKFVGYLIAAVFVVFSGTVIQSITIPYIGEVVMGWCAYPLTLIWIFGLINAMNFFDGLDGLACACSVVAAGFLAVIAYSQVSVFIYLASLTLAASVLGFLVFNWPPARMFMGDIGSTFLGFIFAVMSVLAAHYDHGHTSFFVVPLLLFQIIFDTAYTFVRRLVAGENVFQAHRTHVYQLLNRMGWSHKEVMLAYCFAGICQGVAAVALVHGQNDKMSLIFAVFSSVYLFVATIVVKKAKLNEILR